MTNVSKRERSSVDRHATHLYPQAGGRQLSVIALRKLRQRAHDEIERLLEFLDASEVDPDLEPNLAASERHPSLPWAGYSTREGQFRDRSGDQRFWAEGCRDDREENPDDEPQHDEAEGGIGDEDGLREQLGRTAI